MLLLIREGTQERGRDELKFRDLGSKSGSTPQGPAGAPGNSCSLSDLYFCCEVKYPANPSPLLFLPRE